MGIIGKIGRADPFSDARLSSMAETFDYVVFLSHDSSSPDESAVHKLEQRENHDGPRGSLDGWVIRTGDSILLGIQQALDRLRKLFLASVETSGCRYGQTMVG